MSHLREKVKKTLKAFSMIKEKANVLLCVSGGVDSIVLLDLFASLKDELSIKLAVCHLNHNLRGEESMRDQSFTERAAQRLGLDFYVKVLPEGTLDAGGGGLQESARNARYDFFAEAAEEFGADHIALAHNRDDQGETVLMRILKGSSIKGLGGMPAVRGAYIRPLLEVTRKEVEEYAREEGVEFVEDSSNESTKYLRNKLRLELIPELERDYNTSVKEALVLLSQCAERDNSYIESKAVGLFPEAMKSEEQGKLVFVRQRLLLAHEAISTRLFLMAVEALKGDAKEFYSVHVEAFLNLIRSTEPGLSVDLPGGLRLRREYEQVVIERAEEDALESGYEVALTLPGLTSFGESGSSFRAEILKESPDLKEASRDEAFFDLDKLDDLGSPLTVRTFRAGDRMTPLGMSGVKKVQDIFVDDKVARRERSSVPLLVACGELLWIAGLRQSERAKITPDTLRTLKLTWHRGSVK